MTLEEMIAKTNKRRPGFQLMIDHLKSIDQPLIIETGCARPPDPRWGTIDINFADDGMSTCIFDKFTSDFGGNFYSVDLNPDHVEFAKSQIIGENTEVHCDDSIGFLYHVNKILIEEDRYIDLLYLDSFDYEESDPYPSMVHHIKELLVIFGRLRSGSLLAVDDNYGVGLQRIGKPKYVAELMDNIGIPLIHEGQQLIWRF